MILYSDERCLGYHATGHPERPYRVAASRKLLEGNYPDWEWRTFAPATDESILRAHSQAHLNRLEVARDFDADTAYHEGIGELARLATGASLAAMNSALSGKKAVSLMRPPGHHAERETVMGFCYLNHVAIAALDARARGIEKVAVWDFDAHHGNGTEAILRGEADTMYFSVHQHPCYPGTGTVSVENCRNFPVAPMVAAERHMDILRASWQELLDFEPDLVLVSAGFDAYEGDPLTQMTLRMNDFQMLGEWLNETNAPVAALLEGGYSDDLPQLIEAFLTGWNK